MLVDYQQAQQQMLAWAADREPLNRARLQTIGAALMRRTGGPLHSILGSYDSSQGAFRLASPMTAHRKLIDAQKLPAVVDKLLKQLNTDPATTKTMRQLYDLSFQVHYDLLCLQPFREGNGRVARLLMNYVQYYHDLPISLVHAVDRQAYRRAFDQPQTQSLPDLSWISCIHNSLPIYRRSVNVLANNRPSPYGEAFPSQVLRPSRFRHITH